MLAVSSAMMGKIVGNYSNKLEILRLREKRVTLPKIRAKMAARAARANRSDVPMAV